VTALSLIHIAILHQEGSGNPLGIESTSDKINLFPYFLIKDLFGLALFLIFFAIFLYFFPNILGHSDNYIEANPMVTPTHIVPE